MSTDPTVDARLRAAEDRAAKAEAELARLRAKDDIVAEATAAGFVYPDIVPKLAAPRLEVDAETGKVVNVQQVIRELAAAYPGMVRPGARGGSPHAPGRAAVEGARRELEATGRYHGAM